MPKRTKTDYPGVFYREARRIGGKGAEKVYYVVYRKDGKVNEEKAGRQYANAMTPARAAGIRAELIEGKRFARKQVKEEQKAEKERGTSKWTIDRLWEEYKANKPSLKGLSTYRSAYNLHLKQAFGNEEPKNIMPLDIQLLKNGLLKRRSPQTVQHVLELLRRIINFGVNHRLCKGIDFKIEMPRVDNEKTEDLTPEQLSSLLQAIEKDTHPHAGPMMKMALFTGMRRGELFKLEWKSIDFERGFIKIVDPKGGPDQRIPLNDPARELLGNHPRTRSPFVFPGRNGGMRTNIRLQVNSIKQDAGLPNDFRPLHGLRHVYGSMLASSGRVDMYTLQRLLTHKDPKTTQRYAHLRDEALRKASNLAGSIIQQASNGNGENDAANMEGKE